MELEDTIVTLPKNEAGIKLPYFHRVLDEKDKSLIGDSTPKRILQQQDSTTTTTSGSAWNKAGTWEEFNVSKWAINNLTTSLSTSNFECEKNNFKMVVSGVDNVTGNANISFVRGKQKYLYEFAVRLNIEVIDMTTNSACKGTLSIDDLCCDQLDDMELSVEWKKSPSGSAYSNSKNLAIGSDVKKFTKDIFLKFEEDYRNIQGRTSCYVVNTGLGVNELD